MSDSMPVNTLVQELLPQHETIFSLQKNMQTDDPDKTADLLSVSLRKLQPEPPIEPVVARAKARSHVFYDVATFAKYVLRESSEEGSVVLANPDSKSMGVVLDEGREFDRETVTFQAKYHPMFEAWQKLIGRPMPVLAFALHCMQYRRTIQIPDGRELALVFSQITVAKQVTMQAGIGKKAINGVMVEVNISGKVSQEIVEIPDELTIACPVFIGGTPQTITIDLVVDSQGEQVVVYLTAPDLIEREFVAFEAMAQHVSEATGRLVGMGQIQHRDWVVVK